MFVEAVAQGRIDATGQDDVGPGGDRRRKALERLEDHRRPFALGQIAEEQERDPSVRLETVVVVGGPRRRRMGRVGDRVAVRVAKPLRKPKTTFAMFEKADERTNRMEGQ